MAQSTPSEIAQKTLDIIPYVMRIMSSEMRRAGKHVSPGHMGLMGILTDGPFTLGELAEMHSVSAPTMSKTVNALEERGWVTRTRSEEDRRIVHITLSAEGQQVLDDIETQTRGRISEYVNDLTDQERETLLAGLTILGDRFDRSARHTRDVR